jgi:hypothetical protein
LLYLAQGFFRVSHKPTQNRHVDGAVLSTEFNFTLVVSANGEDLVLERNILDLSPREEGARRESVGNYNEA